MFYLSLNSLSNSSISSTKDTIKKLSTGDVKMSTFDEIIHLVIDKYLSITIISKEFPYKRDYMTNCDADKIDNCLLNVEFP